MRISAILGIHIGLRTLFNEEQEGVAWLRRPHDAQAFGGAAPIDLITSGFQDVLLTVRRFVDAARGGLYMSPSSAERDWPLYDDSEIIRSEEHTSELQSLMRISYAVFCLKKKTKLKKHSDIHRT